MLTPNITVSVRYERAPTLVIVDRRVGWNIIHRAADLTGHTTGEITGESRRQELVHTRWAISRRLARQGWSTPRIGRLLGGRDHTTIMHGLRRGDYLYPRDPDFRSLCDEIAR